MERTGFERLCAEQRQSTPIGDAPDRYRGAPPNFGMFRSEDAREVEAIELPVILHHLEPRDVVDVHRREGPAPGILRPKVPR